MGTRDPYDGKKDGKNDGKLVDVKKCHYVWFTSEATGEKVEQFRRVPKIGENWYLAEDGTPTRVVVTGFKVGTKTMLKKGEALEKTIAHLKIPINDRTNPLLSCKDARDAKAIIQTAPGAAQEAMKILRLFPSKEAALKAAETIRQNRKKLADAKAQHEADTG